MPLTLRPRRRMTFKSITFMACHTSLLLPRAWRGGALPDAEHCCTALSAHESPDIISLLCFGLCKPEQRS